jgi:hypothetical protein
MIVFPYFDYIALCSIRALAIYWLWDAHNRLRQYRYEPPPEFLLASPYSGIDHHLSGPNR